MVDQPYAGGGLLGRAATRPLEATKARSAVVKCILSGGQAKVETSDGFERVEDRMGSLLMRSWVSFSARGEKEAS